MALKNKYFEAPVVTIDNYNDYDQRITIHNLINLKGKMVLNKQQASLLYIELHNFITGNKR